MTVANLANISIHYKVQSGLGSPSSGSGAYGLEVTPSSGLARKHASIESEMLQRSRMKKKPRQGSQSVDTAYETELIVGALDPWFEGVLGGTWAAAATYTHSDWGNVVISGSGTIATFASGTLLTDGVVAGMMIKFTLLSEAGNNDIWVPILSVTSETVANLAPGLLVDNADDAAWSAIIAKSLYTATPYTDRLFTIEEYLGSDLDRSKLGTDMRLNKLVFDCQPDSTVKISLGAGGRDLDLLATGSSPNFTDATFVDGPSLVLLDGGIYINGVKRVNLTSFNWGLEAPVSFLPVIGTKISPDVFIGQFALSGQFTGALENGDDWDIFDAETQVSVILHCAENEADPSSFVTFYLGNLSYAGWTTPSGGEGGVIQTIPLYGGEDERGAGYAATSVLISTSAA